MSYDIADLSPLKRNWIFRNSNIPRRFMGLEPSDIIERTGKFPQLVEDWIETVYEGKVIRNIGDLGVTGVGLLFDGEPGLGKTTHAVVALMELIRHLPDDPKEAQRILGVSPEHYGMNLRPIYYMTYPEFLSRKKAQFDADPDSKRQMFLEMEGFHGRSKDDTLNVRALVLDDLGKEYNTTYNDSSFDEILRARFDKAFPTLITTNVSREQWANQYGAAMGSFAHEAFHRVVIQGKDLRKG